MDEQGLPGICGKRALLLKACRLLFILAVLIAPLWADQAFATTYDDFSSGMIKAAKWTITDPDKLFSVAPGAPLKIPQAEVLKISGSGSASFPKSSLATTKQFSGDLFAGINFFHFTADYTPTASDPSDPGVSLVISGGSSDPVFIVSRAHSASGQVIGWREQDSSGAVLSAGSVPCSETSGALLLSYAGNRLSLGYSPTTHPASWAGGNGYASSFIVVATFPVTFAAKPSLQIAASGGGGGTLGADVGGLYYFDSQLPAPLKGPASLYDDFSAPLIQASKWKITDPTDSFSVVPGNSVEPIQTGVLQFSGSGSSSFPESYLTTMRPFDSFLSAGMNFFNFTSDYTPTAGDASNPSIDLRILFGPSGPVFIVSRTHSSSGEMIEWRKQDAGGNILDRGSAPYSGASGALLMMYNAMRLSLGYSPSTDPKKWADSFRALAVLPVVFTATTHPTIEIGGSGGRGGSVSADVGGLYFSALRPALVVTLSGTGTGKVSSSPKGINCGATCGAAYAKGAQVALTPTPDSGSVFTKWSGCREYDVHGTCYVTMNKDTTTVGAGFDTGSCGYALSSKAGSVSYKGGAITVGVTAGDHNFCTAPEVTQSPDWITYTATALTHNKGSIKITVSEYDYSAGRTGSMIIGGKTFTVNQTGEPCGLPTLSSPSSGLFPVGGGTGTFTVTVVPPDCALTAKASAQSASWINVDSGATGTGTSHVHYVVECQWHGQEKGGDYRRVGPQYQYANTIWGKTG